MPTPCCNRAPGTSLLLATAEQMGMDPDTVTVSALVNSLPSQQQQQQQPQLQTAFYPQQQQQQQQQQQRQSLHRRQLLQSSSTDQLLSVLGGMGGTGEITSFITNLSSIPGIDSKHTFCLSTCVKVLCRNLSCKTEILVNQQTHFTCLSRVCQSILSSELSQ